jgi:hypothetical protein
MITILTSQRKDHDQNTVSSTARTTLYQTKHLSPPYELVGTSWSWKKVLQYSCMIDVEYALYVDSLTKKEETLTQLSC